MADKKNPFSNNASQNVKTSVPSANKTTYAVQKGKDLRTGKK